MIEEAKAKKPSGWLNVLVDYGPLLVFLGVYLYTKPEGESVGAQVAAVIASTGAFMLAAIVALAFSLWKFGRVSPMLWLSTSLIIVFGGVTVLTGNQRVIQVKPTVLYSAFGVILLIGYWRGRAMLQVLLEAAFEGLTETGWLLLSRNWGVFFVALAILNETLVAFLSFENWLWAKLWVFMPLTFLFTFTQIPMLLRNGLDVAEDATEEQPPTG